MESGRDVESSISERESIPQVPPGRALEKKGAELFPDKGGEGILSVQAEPVRVVLSCMYRD